MKIVFEDSSYTATALSRIESACNVARTQVVVDPVKVWEYSRTEAQARAYAAGGFKGPAPRCVKSWTDAKHRQGWTDRQAAEDILATAARWEGLLDTIRDIRLKANEDIRAARGKVEIDAVVTRFESELTTIMTGVL